MLRRVSIASFCGAIVLTASVSARPPARPTFFDDDPLMQAPESQDAAGVQAREPSLVYDILANSFARPGDPEPSPALDTNTIDEVPDSGWFTNGLVGGRAGSLDLVAPPEGDSPADGVWTIVRSKSEGVTPGFTIRDARRSVWFIKFDPPGSLELASGAEAVATRLFRAAGYFVPDNRVARFRREQLVVDKTATIGVAGNRRRPMRDDDIDALLRRVARSPDGSYRVLASRGLPGRAVGPFSYHGRRSDDPNDLVPHEHRRVLRGLRALAAWTQHVDTKGGNSLDTIVEQNGRHVVRHHLIDLGSTLGSAAIGPREFSDGHESLVELDRLWRGVIGFGLPIAPWRTIPYPNLPALGRFEGERFVPERWTPSIPNPAFLRAQPADLFWGARRVAAFSDAMIAAAVEAGQYSDRRVAASLTRALIERRRRIAQAWLPIVNPIVDPTLDDAGVLRFVNAAVLAGASAPPASGYRADWFRFDNATGESAPIGRSSGASELQAPPLDGYGPGAYIAAEVHAEPPAPEPWRRPVRLVFRRAANGWTLVGLTRL
jgi:hypothetical protein